MKINKLTNLSLASAIIITAMSTSIPVNAASYDIAAPVVTSDTIGLDWAAQDGADAYKLYMYDKKVGNFVPYKMYSSDSCMVKDLEPDTKYKFRVESLALDDNGRYKKISSSGAVEVSTASVSDTQDTQDTTDAQDNKPAQSEKQPVQTSKDDQQSGDTLKKKTRKFEKRDLSLEIEEKREELEETKKEIVRIRKEIADCKKRMEANKKIIAENQNAKYDRKEQEACSIARQEIEKDNKLIRDLTIEEHRLYALENRLITQLHSMGVRDV